MSSKSGEKRTYHAVKMLDKVLLSLMAANALFLGTGGLMVSVTITAMNEWARGPSLDTAASNLLLMQTPHTGVLVNAGFIIATFFLSFPAIALSRNRFWLKVQGWAVLFCGCLTLVLGLDIWFRTLSTRSNLSLIWGKQTVTMQSLLQQKFDCCGYLDAVTPPFQRDATCPNALVAAQKLGCVGSFSNFANGFLDIVFTSLFGIVALDVILLLCIAMVLKQRAERERYWLIDEKSGFRRI